jgi:hypothetical protein
MESTYYAILELVVGTTIPIGVILLGLAARKQENSLIEFYRQHQIPGHCNCRPGDSRCLH